MHHFFKKETKKCKLFFNLLRQERTKPWLVYQKNKNNEPSVRDLYKNKTEQKTTNQNGSRCIAARVFFYLLSSE